MCVRATRSMSPAPRLCSSRPASNRPCRSGMNAPPPGGPTPASTRTFASPILARNARIGMFQGLSSSRPKPRRNVTKLPKVSSIGKSSVILEGERAAAGEAVFDRVPVADLILSQTPAEQNRFAAAERGEVDEPVVDVLHLHAVRCDVVHGLREGARLLLDVVRRLGECGGRDAAAVSPNAAFELFLTGERIEMSGAA